MLCDRCGKNAAVCVVKRNRPGAGAEQALCFRCLLEDEYGSEFVEMLRSLGAFDGIPKRCSKCGTSYAEFSATGRLGCASCYDEFKAELEPLIERLHGASRHKGKVPFRARVRIREEAERLESALKVSLSESDFDEACRILERMEELGLLISGR